MSEKEMPPSYQPVPQGDPGSYPMSQQGVAPQAYAQQPGYQPVAPGYPPGQPGYPPGEPGYPQGQPGYPPGQPGYPQGQPGYPQGQPMQGYPGSPGQQTTIVVQQQPHANRSGETAAAVSMVGAYVTSCLVFWCCNPLFGLIGFILAVIGSSFVGSGNYETAKKLSIAAIIISIIGIVITVIIIIVAIVMVMQQTQDAFLTSP